jgi:MoxR-like ATPase
MNPKTQSAFLQAMEEKSVSLSRKHFELWKYFRVIATQNPIELSGTFSLPEAQLDRFFAKISIGSPSKELQQKILLQNTALTINSKIENLSPIFEKHELDEIWEAIYQIHVDEKIAKRLVDFFENIKNHQNILYPLSQRGISLFLLAAKANAFIHQRTFLTPNDAYSVIPAVLIHRLNIEKNSHHIIQELFKDAFKNF